MLTIAALNLLREPPETETRGSPTAFPAIHIQQSAITKISSQQSEISNS
jgi:hypothetical protein